jgi:hypothetical protein
MSTSRELLRHAVATLAYRGGKALRGVPPGFADFRASENSRTAGELLAHLGDLIEWANSMAREKSAWREAPLIDWEQGTARFHAALADLDAYLGSDAPLQAPAEKLLQGPLADALTHIGQIALLRRLAGAPMSSENYFAAEVAVGRVGADQAGPRKEW